MVTKERLQNAALNLFDYTQNPAVKYRLKTGILMEEADEELAKLFLKSDIVNQLYDEQDEYGGWGPYLQKTTLKKVSFQPHWLPLIVHCISV